MRNQPRKRLTPVKRYFDTPDTSEPLLPPSKGAAGDDTVRSKDKWTSDFIWNTDWQAKWAQREFDTAQHAKAQAEAASKVPEGFLSFSRVADLNDMSVDMSEALRAPRKPLLPKRVSPIDAALTGKKTTKRYADPPTPHQTHRWDRSRNYVKRGEIADAMALSARKLADPESVEAEMRAAEAARFEQLRQEYNLWTTATAAVCFTLIYFNYPREVAASYLVGALGGIIYLRLLNKSVAAVGADGIGAAITSAASQPRLLIPVILVMVFNRYNLLYADSVGLHLQLLPMLAGFFTYKAGVIGRSTLSLVREVRGKDDVGNPMEWAAQRAADVAKTSGASAADGEQAAARTTRQQTVHASSAGTGAASATAAADAMELAIDRQVRNM